MVRFAIGTLLMLLGGCAHTHDDLAADVTELEVQLLTLRRELRSLEKHVEAAASFGRSSSGPEVEVGERVAVLEAERLALRDELRTLREELSRVGRGRTLGEPRVLAEPPGAGALPRDEATLEVVSVGSGELLLVRVGGNLQRLKLVGVQAPRRGADYEGEPSLLEAHGEAFKLDLDLAWSASKEQLEGLLAGKTPRVRYDKGGSRRDGQAIRAYVEVQGKAGEWRDLGAAMIRGGFALASGEHGLKEGYQAMQRAAATDAAGLRRSVPGK